MEAMRDYLVNLHRSFACTLMQYSNTLAMYGRMGSRYTCLSTQFFYVDHLADTRVSPLLRRSVTDRGKSSHVLDVLLPTDMASTFRVT